MKTQLQFIIIIIIIKFRGVRLSERPNGPNSDNNFGRQFENISTDFWAIPCIQYSYDAI